jgi:hypothetical protein
LLALDVNDVVVFEPDWVALDSAADENPFMHAAVELLKSAIGLSDALAKIASAQPLQTNAAIRCGSEGVNLFEAVGSGVR